MDHLQTLKHWLVTQENGDEMFKHVYSLEGFAARSIVNSFQQAKITDFFKQI